MLVACGQSNSSSLSLYLSVIDSLADIVGIRRLLADSAVTNLLQRVLRPTVCCSLIMLSTAAAWWRHLELDWCEIFHKVE